MKQCWPCRKRRRARLRPDRLKGAKKLNQTLFWPGHPFEISSRDDDGTRFAMARDGLWSTPLVKMDNLAKLNLCILQRPQFHA